MICGKDISTNNTHYNQKSSLLSRENGVAISIYWQAFVSNYFRFQEMSWFKMFPAHWLFQGTLQREKLEQLSQMICTVKTARFIIAVIGLIS